MFGTIVIGANQYRSHLIQNAANASLVATILHCGDGYPDKNELDRILSRFGPRIILLDCHETRGASMCVSGIRNQLPGTVILGLGGESGAGAALAIPHHIPFPPNAKALAGALSDALHGGGNPIAENLVAFIPAKAGAGCSTVAMNAAAAVSRQNGKRVLLMDADLRSGAISLMLNWRQDELANQGYLQTALSLISEMDELRWENTITSAQGMDLLLSSRTALDPPPTWGHYHELIRFAVPRYHLIAVDLPELVNPATAEIVRSARQVCLVTTQELLSVKMAERRIRELRDWGVPDDRVCILLNRWHRQQVPASEVGTILRYPILGTFPNDYAAVNAATMAGRPVSRSSALGRAFHDFGKQLAGSSQPVGVGANWLSRLKKAVAAG